MHGTQAFRVAFHHNRSNLHVPIIGGIFSRSFVKSFVMSGIELIAFVGAVRSGEGLLGIAGA
jgi:hypothetical protein